MSTKFKVREAWQLKGMGETLQIEFFLFAAVEGTVKIDWI